jgi:hypothetical protein
MKDEWLFYIFTRRERGDLEATVKRYRKVVEEHRLWGVSRKKDDPGVED